MTDKPCILTDTGRIIEDRTVKCSVGVAMSKGKRRVALGVHDSEVGVRIYPLSRHDALMIADGLMRAAQAVDDGEV